MDQKYTAAADEIISIFEADKDFGPLKDPEDRAQAINTIAGVLKVIKDLNA